MVARDKVSGKNEIKSVELILGLNRTFISKVAWFRFLQKLGIHAYFNVSILFVHNL